MTAWSWYSNELMEANAAHLPQYRTGDCVCHYRLYVYLMLV